MIRVRVASNTTDDRALLSEALPNLRDCTRVEAVFTTTRGGSTRRISGSGRMHRAGVGPLPGGGVSPGGASPAGRAFLVASEPGARWLSGSGREHGSCASRPKGCNGRNVGVGPARIGKEGGSDGQGGRKRRGVLPGFLSFG